MKLCFIKQNIYLQNSFNLRLAKKSKIANINNASKISLKWEQISGEGILLFGE